MGQNGQQVLNWLASALDQVGENQPLGPLLPDGSPVFMPAARWLEASGLAGGAGASSPGMPAYTPAARPAVGV
jgi:hypothetical protein